MQIKNQIDAMMPNPIQNNVANANFNAFIFQCQSIATEAGFQWEMGVTEIGIAKKPWDLRTMAKDGRPGSIKLRTFSRLEDVYARLAARGQTPPPGEVNAAVSTAWQDLIKAFAIEHILIRKKGIGHVASAAAALRALATVSGKEPWLVTADDIQLTCDISDECQPSGGRSIVLRGMVATLIDPLHLFDTCPLSALVAKPDYGRKGRAKFAIVESQQPKNLADRKNQEKLPERRAFWELIRIVFTERPRTLNDALRFAMIKILLMTGLRVNEVALLPFDWKRTRTYIDGNGRPAGESGGISESLMLRYFAEKQENSTLYELTQFIPSIFEDEVKSVLEEVSRLTAPLRKTLKDQYETGRIFPMYEPDQLVHTVEMYVRLSGNPIWAESPLPAQAQECIDKYVDTLDNNLLLNISNLQARATALTPTISRYFSNQRRGHGLVLRHRNGSPVQSTGVWLTYMRVSEVEAYVRSHLPTKLSDLKDLTLDNGSKLAPWELLFLMPKRAVGAGRGQTILDPNKTFSVGIADPGLLHVALGAESQKDRSLFSVYGETDDDKALKINTHSFRHLQNTELFRLGVADTIITKRFGRRSVAQSHEYDHRSLAELLDHVDLPEEWDMLIGEGKAATVAKLIQVGRANGPIVSEFKRIQREEGDNAALQFLAAEADGFHATPYGTCLNSFTVDPCPKHLECFTGCRHLSATDLPEHRKNIINLHGRLKIAMEQAKARPIGSMGRENQIAHAAVRLEGVERLMNAQPGESVFPSGNDLSQASHRESVLHDA